MADRPDEPVSRDLDRLRALKQGRDGALGQIQAEIVRERALSHTRAVERVERALAALTAAEAALDAAGADRADRLAAYDTARAAAIHARWELEVQREAIGHYSPADLDRDFPIPPRRK